MTAMNPGATAAVGVPAVAPASGDPVAAARGAATGSLPGGHDRCVCGDLASEHDIGTRKGTKARTACSRGTCDCRTYQPADTPTEVTR